VAKKQPVGRFDRETNEELRYRIEMLGPKKGTALFWAVCSAFAFIVMFTVPGFGTLVGSDEFGGILMFAAIVMALANLINYIMIVDKMNAVQQVIDARDGEPEAS
jgi:predicted permease